MRASMKWIISQESCLGYLYPRRVDETSASEAGNFGSFLGVDNRVVLNNDSREKNRAPGASNLASLLTYPKKICSKNGALLCFEGLAYPQSYFEEALER